MTSYCLQDASDTCAFKVFAYPLRLRSILLLYSYLMTWHHGTEDAEIQTLRWVALASVGVTVSVLFVAVVGCAILFIQTYTFQVPPFSSLFVIRPWGFRTNWSTNWCIVSRNRTICGTRWRRFCTADLHKNRPIWLQLEIAKGTRSRRKRQFFLDYCNDLVQCGGPTNCGQEHGCTVHAVHQSSGCGNTDSSGCATQTQPVVQMPQFRPQVRN